MKLSVVRYPVAVLLLLASVSLVRADVVLDWNRVASDVLRDNLSLQNPGMASRSLAMMNLAIYDAFAMTTPGDTMFFNYGGGHQSPGMTADYKAAAAQAAYTVLSGIYDDQYATLNGALSASLSAVPDSAAKTEGIAMGAMIGHSILAERASDGYDSLSQYLPTDEPGHWQSDPINPGQEAWGPAWGEVTPFALASNRQFMPGRMPALTSKAYADAFNEVKELGAADSTTRTAEQTEIGNFWAYDRAGMGTPHRLFGDVLQTIAAQQANTPKENAELFAKATVAMADAGVVAWNSKFQYDFWRPVTGIREADLDGNPLTEADPDWTPLGAPGGDGNNNFTPPFPTYVSGHATFGGALFGVLQEFYGTDDIAFTLASEEMPGVLRDYDSFSEAMAENGRSRVYLGIHWNFDDTVGQQLGLRVADYLFNRPFVTAVPEPSALGLAALAALGMAGRRR
ncbi:PEP-CTERM sorting domain-containing protein [Botrimarina sp.]|uniref:vanadium-dependent haloperoxidase n=1 Tax=Botrimarina sp. TaxID=2795802 RepID=UPI0032EDE3AB